jgi:hypothetical protein
VANVYAILWLVAGPLPAGRSKRTPRQAPAITYDTAIIGTFLPTVMGGIAGCKTSNFVRAIAPRDGRSAGGDGCASRVPIPPPKTPGDVRLPETKGCRTTPRRDSDRPPLLVFRIFENPPDTRAQWAWGFRSRTVFESDPTPPYETSGGTRWLGMGFPVGMAGVLPLPPMPNLQAPLLINVRGFLWGFSP